MGFDTIEINLIGSKNELGQAKVLSQKTFPKNFRSKKIHFYGPPLFVTTQP